MDLLKWTALSLLILVSSVQAKDFNAKEISELKQIHLKIDSSKKKKLLYFWASWCPDCRGKLRGELQDLKKQRKDVEILTVNVDRKQSKGESFIKDESLPFPVVRDESRVLRKKLKVFSVPSWAIIEQSDNKSWKVIAKDAGSDIAKITQNLGAQ